MKITALDIRQKTFEQKTFRGIDRDEVQAFLNLISQQWERMGDENRELRLKLEHAQQDVQKMREVESSLYRTLKTAEDTGQSITEQAQRDADLRVREAQFQAEQLLNEARQTARKVVGDAYQQAEKTVSDMQREVSTLGQECQRLESQLDGLVRDLHHLASEALEKAEKAQSRTKAGAGAILSRAASVKVERPKELAVEPEKPMLVSHSSAISSAASVGGSAPAAFARQEAPGSQASTFESVGQPTSYNPKPGQQPDPYDPYGPDRTTEPDPYEPARVPSPDVERPGAPAENPGISPAPHIDQPGPSQVPSPQGPRVEPIAPDIQPIGPDRPEIQQPQPMTHPGMAAEVPAVGRSFFDEI
jgi:cell division initiation protein